MTHSILTMTRWVVLALVVFPLGACALPSAAEYDAPMDVQDNTPYVLQAGDSFKLTVFGEETITGDYLIDQRGMVILPMLGEFAAAGLSEETLQKQLAEAFVKGGFLTKPLVTVDAASVRPVAIMGEVKAPGSFAFRPKQTVFQAIAQAGGYTPRAAKNKILIDRFYDGKLVRLNATEETPILPGDSITVRERIF